ncbi:MAG: response regulator transcription factor [Thiovulaceae bacterium]|nr:response regulator transcription factor [Sulfurimonadaceae bacterium]
MKILIVEDDANILSFLNRGLVESNHTVITAMDGEEGEYLALTNSYDVIILDWMLPHKNGIDLLQSIREKNITTPVLILSAKGEIKDKIFGLKHGADDYLSKPFSFDELEARVEALYRRSLTQGNNSFVFGDLIIDIDKKSIIKDAQIVTLSLKEYELLLFLIKHKNAIVSNAMIEEQLWGDEEYKNSNVIQVTIYNIKKKIGKELIKNQRGLGYILEIK